MLGVFWKIQEICSKMGTRILKIDLEMTEIIDTKDGKPPLWRNKICHQNDTVKIEDILPFFPDFVTIDHFKDQCCHEFYTIKIVWI